MILFIVVFLCVVGALKLLIGGPPNLLLTEIHLIESDGFLSMNRRLSKSADKLPPSSGSPSP